MRRQESERSAEAAGESWLRVQLGLGSLSARLAGASGSQGLQRLLWLSDKAGAARLLRW